MGTIIFFLFIGLPFVRILVFAFSIMSDGDWKPLPIAFGIFVILGAIALVVLVLAVIAGSMSVSIR